jgi:hypothetical protein
LLSGHAAGRAGVVGRCCVAGRAVRRVGGPGVIGVLARETGELPVDRWLFTPVGLAGCPDGISGYRDRPRIVMTTAVATSVPCSCQSSLACPAPAGTGMRIAKVTDRWAAIRRMAAQLR